MDSGDLSITIILVTFMLCSAFKAWVNKDKPDCDEFEDSENKD